MSTPPPSTPSRAALPCRAPIALALVAALSGCGGGGGEGGVPDAGGDGGAPESGGTTSPPDAGPEVRTASVGTLVLERQGDKLTADAWFVPAASVDATPSASEPDGSSDRCALDPLALDGVAGHGLPGFAAGSGDAPSAPPTLAPAARLVGTARDGEFLSLEPQRLGRTVVYATAPNWIRDPLPEDLRLAVLDESGADLFDPLALRPLADPTLLAPESGRLESLSDPVLWSVPPAGDDTRLRLFAHAWKGETGESAAAGRAVTIRCTLVDDGEFVVPAALRAEIGDEGGRWTVRLARERRSRVERDGSRLDVVQLVLP